MLAHLYILMGKALIRVFSVVDCVNCLDSVELDSEFESTLNSKLQDATQNSKDLL